MANLHSALTGLAPIFALIALGYGLRRWGFPGEALWAPLERLVYFVLFPALLIHTLGTAQVSAAQALAPAVAVCAAICAVAALMAMTRPLLGLDGPAFSSLFQAGIRFNTYVGMAAALSLFGQDGAAVAAMILAVMIPLVNVLSVAVLTRHAQARTGTGVVLRGIVRNPLILACAAGIVLNATGIGLSPAVDATVEALGRAALPLGLMTVGAGLQIRAAWTHRGPIGLSLAIKLLVMPLAMWLFAGLLALPALETQVLVLFGALPTATSAYILARQLGGDAALLAGMLTAQTLAAAVTLPVTLLLIAG